MAAQILLSLSILVGLHEAGHLLAAKFFGMRVEQFSIGFPPKIFSFKYGETEYALSAIPLGGFVKISGMIDESMDTEAMKLPPKEYEFRSKPAWQRLIVMLGGIIVNVILGVFIFICLTYLFGSSYLSKDLVNENGGIVAYELAEEIGLKTGDKIIKISGKEFDDFNDVVDSKLFLSDNAYYNVLRDGKEITVDIPGNFIENMNDEDAMDRFIFPKVPASVISVSKKSVASAMGLKENDLIYEINNKPVYKPADISKILKGDRGKDSVNVKLKRGEQFLSFSHSFKQDTLLGIVTTMPKGLIKEINYGIGESIALGTKKAFSVVFLQIQAFGKMFSGQLSVRKSLSGPIGIAKAYGGNWDWQRFWRMTGLLSMVLAFMNLLPIPALDGGHVVFLTYEMISGRKPSDKFLENAQKVGMVLLLSLMVFIIGNDIFKLFD